MKRMTVDVLRADVNNMLKTSTCSEDERKGMIAVMEHVLFRTSNYHGFQYLSAQELAPGTKPGIRWENTVEDRFKDTDPTRIRFL